LKDSQQAFENYENIVKSHVLRFLPITVIASIYYGLGELCVLQRKFKLALINMEIALGVEQFCRPKSDGRQLAHYYHAIGQVHAELRNNNEALRYYQMAIDLARQCFPHHHPFIGKCMASKSVLLYHENRLEEASSDVIESGQILANSLSTNHGMQVLVHMTTAQNLLEKNDFSGALSSYQSALKCSHEHISPNHPKNAPILWAIAFVHSQQKQFDEALSILQEALNIQTAVLPSNHPNLAMTYTLIGDVLDNQQNPSALSYYQRALDIQLKCLPATHPSIVHLQQVISRLERRLAAKRFT
jgi:tetratricopeptide (TPR) repeat protein